ncbi:mannosyltransferase [Krasilnikovia cinnamomea]|uniref:Mannosyltransferase n=1 Tax=Krasilnikovia cinnamomea TaxID=349313 RepID=A0A4Q7ZIB2_9ACTN|nr:glycosyltransferase family 39 protein [Krasilnikovia cinnamomea]RZU50578.1 mannosyltransferase [Krasilnikovia cinnamomea]
MAIGVTTGAGPTPDGELVDAAPVPVPKPSTVRSAAAVAAAPFAFTLAVMLFGIGDRQLWRDEHATWWAASLSWGDLRHLVGTVDVVLFPYYVLMHVWIGVFGASPTALRLPSALFMAVAAGLLALLGRRLFDAPSGVVAGLLLAVIPAISRYGQEARPYAMTLAATVAAALLLMRALEKPSPWRWVGYGLAVLWVACSHIVALMALAAHLVVVAAVLARAGARRRPILFGWPLAVGAALLIAAPLVLVGSRQGGQISWVPDPVWARVESFPASMFMSGAVAGSIVVLGVAALALMHATPAPDRRPGLLLAVWAVLPPVVAYYTFDEFSLFYPRYLLFTVPAWVLAAGWALRRLAGSTRALVPVALAAVVALAAAGLPDQRFVRSDAVENEFAFAAAARYLGDHESPGDGVVYTGYRKTHRAFRYELEQAGRPVPPEVLTEPPSGQPWSWQRRDRADPVAALAGYQRVWLVSTNPDDDILSSVPPAVRAALAQRYTVADTQTFHRMRVSLLVAG